MIKNINQLVNNKKCYNYLIKYLPLLTNDKIHQLHRYKGIYYKEISMKTFEGKFACGATSYLLYHYIKTFYNIDIKFMLSTFGYGKYKEDHLFLTYNKYIIDPTYKQFIYSSCHNMEYNNFVSNNSPFVYIGNDFVNFYKLYQRKYFDITNEHFSNDNLVFWEKPKDVTQRYLDIDLNEIIITDTKEKQYLLDSLFKEIR